jgi:osmotically-inducible protein OsmY
MASPRYHPRASRSDMYSGEEWARRFGADWSDAERAEASRQLRRMNWRAAGAQDYPGGAFDTLLELSHRGRGPKGYRPSDERLTEIICERLTDDPFIDASDVTVDVRNNEVTLSGRVSVRQQKFAIEDVVADVAGVTEIHNRISVGSEEIEQRMSGL